MDYFVVKQSYYTGNFSQALKELEQADSKDDTALFYKAKSLIALQQYETVTGLGGIWEKYSGFIQSVKDTSALEEAVGALEEASLFHLHLLATAKALLGELDKSLEICTNGIDNASSDAGMPELVLLAVQVALLKSQPHVASAIFQNYVSAQEVKSEDDVIMQAAEAYLNFASNKDTTGSNFYHFEELAQSFPTWKTQLCLLNLQLQQHNFVEAQGIIDTLESDFYLKEQKEVTPVYKQHLIAAKITLAAMQSQLSRVADLTKELETAGTGHSMLQNHKEMNHLFDEVVAKYSTGN